MTTTTATCSGPECDRPAASLGLCNAHHQQHKRGKPLTQLRYRNTTPVIDRAVDALWCIGHAATVTEIAERAGATRDAVAHAMRRNPALFVEAGVVVVGERHRPVPVWRLSDAGVDRLAGGGA